MQPSSLPHPHPHPDAIEPRPVFEKKPLMWEEDMELFSKFIDRKVRRGCSQPVAPTFPVPLSRA